MIRCVVFDNDGVVSVPKEFFSDWYMREHGVPDALMSPFFVGHFQDCMRGTRDLKEELKVLLPSWKWHGSVESFLQLWFEKENVLNQAVIELIMRLKAQGIICCMATNQEKYRLQYLRESAFPGLFDFIYCSAEIGHKKYEPEFFQAVALDVQSRFGIRADEIISIDDEARNVDVAAKIVCAYHFTSPAALTSVLKDQGILNNI